MAEEIDRPKGPHTGWQSFDKPEHQRGFGWMPFNDRRHHSFGFVFNPYGRNAPIHKLDKRVFDALLDWGNQRCHKPDLLFDGCLDAPDEIPLGGTACVRTVGGYFREEYLSLGREWPSWAAYMRACAETATMLRQLLDEADN